MKEVSKIILSVIALLAVLLCCAVFYADYLEVAEIGAEYKTVFFTDISVKVVSFLVCFVLSGVLTYFDLSIVRKNSLRINGSTVLKRKYALCFSIASAAAAGIILCADIYRKVLCFLNAAEAGITEPIFGYDLSYYFFKRPFLLALTGSALSFLLAMLIANLAFYMVTLAKDKSVRETLTDGKVFLHLAVNVILLLVSTGLSYFLEAQGVLLNQDGAVPGALYADVNIKLPFYTLAPYILLIIAAVAAVLLFFKKFRGFLAAALAFPVLFLCVQGVSYAVNVFYVKPNEVTLESEYIKNNITYTNIGFNLDKTSVRTFPADESLTKEDIVENSDIVNNIRITDPLATLEVLNSTKSIRNYYTFNDCDIVEYEIDGKPTAVNISAREIDLTKLEGTADNYINRTLRYTHGYGIVMNPVNAVTEEGQPECVIQDMPIASEEGAPVVTEPRIYYGEKTDDYCIVNTSVNEFDYALNDKNVESKYTGTTSGIKMNFLNKLIFTAKNADYTMLISGYINSESRLLPNRNVIERVSKAVPFLNIDSDPYIVIGEDGRLYWIVDLYTASSQMPYSTRYNGINYIRNSAKAVVDAYNGTVDVYITDETDAIIMTYDKVYPGALKMGGLPSNIAEHIRYPEYLFNLQSEVYCRYHMDDPTAFYANTDLWMAAKEKYRGDDSISVAPYYNLLSVEDFGADGAELILMQPLVPANKENLVAWLAADNYGNIISYRFPAGRTVYGTLHMENRIDSDAAISKELSLWNQGGSTVLRGNMLVIPIADSLIYVEPIYITTSNAAAVPEVKRIIMAYGDDIVMEETLEDCFEAIFGADSEEGEKEEASEVGDAYDLARSAIEAYDRARSAMAGGDWTGFGEAMDDLGGVIDTMRGEEESESMAEED